MKLYRICSRSNVVMIINSSYASFLFLGIYVISLLFSSVQVLPGYSLPFLTAIAFLSYKLLGMLVSRRFLYLKTELYVIVVLYLYLIIAELFLHNGSIANIYFTSFGLNGIMMLFLADEFYRNTNAREYAMRTYAATAVLVGLLIALDIMTTTSSSGRITFMMQNENELAAALFIAYVYLSREFVHINWLRISTPLLVYLLTFIVLLNAMIATGTRFAMVGVVVVACLLTLFAMMDRQRIRNGLAYAAFTASFIAFKINGFPLPSFSLISSDMLQNQGHVLGYKFVGFESFRTSSSDILQNRWSTEVHGNNLQDLGGRLQLWQNSLDAFMQSPFIGLGYNNFHQFITMRDKVFMHPHNFLLEIAAISGAFGLTLTFAVAIIFFWRISVITSSKMIQYVLIWGVPVIIFIMMLGITHVKIFWFLLAFYITSSHAYNKHTNNIDLLRSERIWFR